jgi:hypothetical protein
MNNKNKDMLYEVEYITAKKPKYIFADAMKPVPQK